MGKKLFAAWVSVGLLFLIVGYLFTYQEELRVNLDRVARTHAILSLIYDLQNNLAEAEAMVRGFIITGDKKQLKAYPGITRELKNLIKEIRYLADNDPEQLKLLGDLQPLIDKRLALLDQAVALRQEKGLEEGQYAEITQEGNKVQENIRQIFAKMEKLEKRKVSWTRNGPAKKNR